MHLQIITPTGTQYEGEVKRFQFTSATGLMEFLPGHAPMIAELKEGSIHT
jgi:F-type H+-transporting ATPase subunit epsilon